MPTPRDLRATYRPSEEERCVVLAGELGTTKGCGILEREVAGMSMVC